MNRIELWFLIVATMLFGFWPIVSLVKLYLRKYKYNHKINIPTFIHTNDHSIKPINIEIEKLHDDVKLPEYAHESDSGMDIFAYFENGVAGISLAPLTRVLIKTGIKIAIPNGYEIQVRSKSGLALKEGLMVLNSPGTIDSEYRGEIGIIAYNSDSKYCATISHGQKIAQLVLQQVPRIELEVVDKVDETKRGDSGFGSTGK